MATVVTCRLNARQYIANASEPSVELSSVSLSMGFDPTSKRVRVITGNEVREIMEGIVPSPALISSQTTSESSHDSESRNMEVSAV